jgi:predicted histone-like DNA-binding protein
MPISYRIRQRKNNLSSEKELNYIYQAVSNGTVTMDELAYEISQECTLTETDVIAVLHALGKKMQHHLGDGKTVVLDNVGRFRIGFSGVAQPTTSLLRKAEIKRFYINYQPTVAMKRWLKKGLTLKKKHENE